MEEKKVKRSRASGRSKPSQREIAGSEDFLTYPSPLGQTVAAPAEKELVGDRIRKAREAHGLTLQDLSSRTTHISAPAGFGKPTLLTYGVPRDSTERRSCEECNSGSYEPEI